MVNSSAQSWIHVGPGAGDSVVHSIPDGRYAGYFLLRRLHSLTGVAPVGLFLLEHYFVNAYSWKGHDGYQQMAMALRSLPYLPAIELFLILGPLYFHGLLGLVLVYGGQANVQRHHFMRNWMYLLQRITGVIVILFVTHHVLQTRFAGVEDLYDLMVRILSRPAGIAFYIVGVVAASYHFANGLWGFCITWGLTTGRRAQTVASYVVLVVFVALAYVSVSALRGFLHS